MKVLIAVFCLFFAFSTFANNNPTASEKFTSFVPVGHYVGHTDDGLFCQVIVSEVNFPKKDIGVRVVQGDNDLAKLIAEESDFSYKDYKREFIQHDRSIIGTESTNFVEKIVKTVSAGDHSQYVVVGHAVTINRVREEQTAECIIEIE